MNNRKAQPLLNQSDVCACLHLARELLHDRAEAERGSTKRRLKFIEAAVFNAIGAVARQGLSVKEFRAARQQMLHAAGEVQVKPVTETQRRRCAGAAMTQEKVKVTRARNPRKTRALVPAA